jgi:hypothetical protein
MPFIYIHCQFFLISAYISQFWQINSAPGLWCWVWCLLINLIGCRGRRLLWHHIRKHVESRSTERLLRREEPTPWRWGAAELTTDPPLLISRRHFSPFVLYLSWKGLLRVPTVIPTLGVIKLLYTLFISALLFHLGYFIYCILVKVKMNNLIGIAYSTFF